MDSAIETPETFWENLLSSDPACIRRAWATLTPAEARAVQAHLQDMAQGPGWQPAQQEAAAAALRVTMALTQA
jgi:hypothetical protein